MKAINVSEATPLQLNWLVAKCEGYENTFTKDTSCVLIRQNNVTMYFDPCHEWSWAGPIIERELIGVYPAQRDDKDGMWAARPNYKVHCLFPHLYGPTPLIAAMRCYVAGKLGDVVEVPKTPSSFLERVVDQYVFRKSK